MGVYAPPSMLVAYSPSFLYEVTFHQPPVSSHSSNISNLSQPQNGSPSTIIKGEPNTPLSTDFPILSRSSSFAVPLSNPDRSAAGSTPTAPANSMIFSESDKSLPSLQ